jgi:hypothetical protein
MKIDNVISPNQSVGTWTTPRFMARARGGRRGFEIRPQVCGIVLSFNPFVGYYNRGKNLNAWASFGAKM